MDEQYLKDVFPQLELIKDAAIKNAVINTYLKAAEMGGWDTLEGIPFTLLIDTQITFAEHTKAVTDMALSLGEIM